jgi:hypothetical protein
MPSYRSDLVAQVKKQPLTLGTRLGRWLIRYDVSAQRAALAIGATRQSVYNWIKGGEVLSAYRERVTKVIEVMAKAPSNSTSDDIWRLLCQEFNLKH